MLIVFYFTSIFFLLGLGFELRASLLQSRCSTTGITPLIHFALILEMGVLRTICPGWPRTLILLISASQVTRIIDVSHWHPASLLSL
jgi:hypothetical protein